MSNEPDPSPTEIADILDQLLAGWDSFVETTELTTRGTGSRRGRDRTEGQLAVVIGLATHVHETVRALRPAMPEHLTVVHMPMVRAAYEATLFVAWCDEVADGADALFKEGGRQRRALAAAAEKASLHELADALKRTTWADFETPSGEQARRIEHVANEVALAGAYAYYRMLSSLSHATVVVVDEYVSPAPDGGFELVRHPKPQGSLGWSSLMLYCLIWSGMVANYYDPTRARRNTLRSIARKLGIAPELLVSAKAVNRGGR